MTLYAQLGAFVVVASYVFLFFFRSPATFVLKSRPHCLLYIARFNHLCAHLLPQLAQGGRNISSRQWKVRLWDRNDDTGTSLENCLFSNLTWKIVAAERTNREVWFQSEGDTAGRSRSGLGGSA
jgi:hypothetical protein